MIGGAITDLGLIPDKLRQNVSDNGILPFFSQKIGRRRPVFQKKSLN